MFHHRHLYVFNSLTAQASSSDDIMKGSREAGEQGRNKIFSLCPLSSLPLSFLLLLTMFFASPVQSAFEREPLSAEAMALGGAWVAGEAGFLSNRYNPALTVVESSQFGASYSRPFGIDGLNEGAVEYAHKLPYGGFAANWQRLANSHYKEETITASYARLLANRFKFGANLKLYIAIPEGFKHMLNWDADLGAIWRLSQIMAFGASVSDLLSGSHSERPSQALNLGLSFHPQSIFTMNLACQKRQSEADKIKLMIGVGFQALKNLKLRVGVRNSPWLASAGWEVRYGSVQLDYAWLTHSSLNDTHLVSLTVQLKGDK